MIAPMIVLVLLAVLAQFCPAAPATRPFLGVGLAVGAASSPAHIDRCILAFPSYSLIGKLSPGGTCRYTIQYARAERWGDPQAVVDQSSHDTSSLPPVCPQAPDGPLLASGQRQNEQCLYAVIYTPRQVRSLAGLPIFVWIHGGSYYAGSTSSPGLDGSALVSKGNMIVVVLQYRLGVLGLLPPSISPNSDDPSLAIKDVILSLTQIQRYAEWLGGDRAKVTIGGQSSGASLIRALLAAPSTKGLFRAAILQSDPMTYGTASADTTSKLQQKFYSQPAWSACADLACLQRVPVDVILLEQSRFLTSAPGQVEGVPLVMPLRPTHYTPTIPSDPTAQTFASAYTLPSSPDAISLLITTTANEAGQVVGSIFPYPIPANNATYAQTLAVFVNPDRAKTIVGSTEYGMVGNGADEMRGTFERLITDGVWRCASRDFAETWARQGGKVWVGEWTRGVGYVTNGGAGGYCRDRGRVCHEDDIFPTFHSAPFPTTETAALQDEVLSRWTAFIHNLDPNLRLQGTTTETASAAPFGSGSIGSDRSPAIFSPGNNCTIRVGSHDAVPVSLATDGPSRQKVHSRAKGSPPRWETYTGGEGEVYAIGGGRVRLCPEGYWGEKVKYDWQLYP